jgi:transposase
MLQTQTPTPQTVVTSVSLARQQVPAGARILGIYATAYSPHRGKCERVRILHQVERTPKTSPVDNPLQYFWVAPLDLSNPYPVQRAHLKHITAFIEMECK